MTEAFHADPAYQVLELNPGETNAVYPAKTAVSFFQYFYSYPRWPMMISAAVMVGLASSIASGYWISLPICVAITAIKGKRFFRPLKQVIRQCRVGNVNPGIVLSKTGWGQWRVAVYTDLRTAGEVPKPAIFVGDFPLGRMAGGPPVPGMRVAAPSLYWRASGAEWMSFTPMIANCVVRNPASLRRLVKTPPPEMWQEFEEYLAILPQKKPAIYKLWEGGRPVQVRLPSVWGSVFAWVGLILAALILAIVIFAQVTRPDTKSFMTPRTARPTVTRGPQ